MKYRQMGKWGARLSCLGLGTMRTIGHQCDEETSREIVKIAYDNGVNLFDTANAYSNGEAERMLGKCLKEFPRSSVFILTKVSAVMGPSPNDHGLSAKHIFEQCHASLKRLGIDYLDIYMCHTSDPTVPLEETIRAMEDLAQQGKILYWGVSNWSAAQILKAQGVARDLRARPIAINEPRYSLLYRYPEREMFPATVAEGIGNVVFSPLAYGVLSGKYIPGQPPPKDSRAADPKITRIRDFYGGEENFKKAQELVRIAREMGATAAQLALAWCLKHPGVTSTLLGTRTVEQLEGNLKAADIEIPGEVLVKLENVFPPSERFPII